MAEHSIADMSRSGIYQIVNKANGKRYIGSAKCFKVRWAKHLGDLRRNRHHSIHLQRSWNLRGEDAFSFEIVEICEAPRLIEREQAWMDALAPEYNISPTAGNCLGVKHTEESKLKRSIAMRGRKIPVEVVAKRVGQKRTDEQRSRFSAAQKLAFESLSAEEKKMRADRIAATNKAMFLGKKQSPELIAKRAASLIGRVVSDETRRKISAANKGRKPSDAAIAASVAATKGVKRSDEFRQKCKDRKVSDETRERMSQAAKGKKKSVEVVAKTAEALRGRKLSPEAIAKRTATRRANGGYVVSESTREKLSIAGLGRTVSEETRMKISATKRAKRESHEQKSNH